jgi:hypothetical protein
MFNWNCSSSSSKLLLLLLLLLSSPIMSRYTSQSQSPAGKPNSAAAAAAASWSASMHSLLQLLPALSGRASTTCCQLHGAPLSHVPAQLMGSHAPAAANGEPATAVVAASVVAAVVAAARPASKHPVGDADMLRSASAAVVSLATSSPHIACGAAAESAPIKPQLARMLPCPLHVLWLCLLVCCAGS